MAAKKYKLTFELTGTKQNLRTAFYMILAFPGLELLGTGSMQVKLIREDGTEKLLTINDAADDNTVLERFEKLTGIK